MVSIGRHTGVYPGAMATDSQQEAHQIAQSISALFAQGVTLHGAEPSAERDAAAVDLSRDLESQISRLEAIGTKLLATYGTEAVVSAIALSDQGIAALRETANRLQSLLGDEAHSASS